MAAVVSSDSCVLCGACAPMCPVGAISVGDTSMVVDADVCISCETCIDECPIGAISME